MKAQVQLPADPLIEYWSFSKAIACAICPASELELKGVDCIVGKLVTHHVAQAPSTYGEQKWPITAGLQSIQLPDDGRTLDQLCLNQPEAAAASTHFLPLGGEVRYKVVELTLPYKLTNDDRQLMETLMADLPALHYPILEEERASFMSAYFNLPNRPAWEPVLITATTIERRKAEQNEVLRQHQQSLQKELAQGRLEAVNANHVPVTRFSIGDFLPRDHAIAYLKRCGMAHVDKADGSHQDTNAKKPALHREWHEGKQGAVGEPKLSDKERRDVVAFRNELKRKKIKGYTKKTAEKFGITDRYVRDLVAQAKDEQEENRIDLLLVKKRQ